MAISALSAAIFYSCKCRYNRKWIVNAVYVDSGGNAQGHIGGGISFAMSTTTDGGVLVHLVRSQMILTLTVVVVMVLV